MRVEALTPEQTNALKGVGILVIVLHNFLHNIPPVMGENQFLFDSDTLLRFLAVMVGPATEWVRAAFSFLGHYGVSAFVFLSAYGLTRRYTGRRLEYWLFLRQRFVKIYVTFVTCVGLYVVLWALQSQVAPEGEPLEWRSLLLKLTLVSNLVPRQAMAPVGPWWFMAFIFQCYLVFPWLLRVADRWGVRGLATVAVLSVVCEGLWNPSLVEAGLNMNHTPIGHLAVLCLGIVAARADGVTITRLTIVLVCAGFALGNLYPSWWLLSDVWAAVLFVAGPVMVARLVPLPAAVSAACAFYGGISMPLFLVNGFLRGPFHDLAVARSSWWFTLVCALASLGFSTLVALALDRLDRGVRQAGRALVRQPV